MKIRKFEIIKCPKCDYEYLPAEIYIPKYYFGTPTSVERDFSGRILSYSGESLNPFETYTCDNCNTMFRVTSRVQFLTEIDKLENFDEEYTTPMDKSELFEEKDD